MSKPDTWKCEWCGNELRNVEAIAETEPGVFQAVGWCPKHNTKIWSEAVKRETRNENHTNTQC